jgi:hypothetical protein
VHVRRPRIDYESHVAHLDRNELGAILVAAGLPAGHVDVIYVELLDDLVQLLDQPDYRAVTNCRTV